MVIVVRAEPLTVAAKVIASGIGTSQATSQRLFNATLGILDAEGVPRPYLAEVLPELGTDTWQVFPDGRMQTTHRLRSGATWHDGTPHTAQDFVFAWQVYTAPQIGIASSAPQNLIAEVAAPDPATVVINWKRPFPNAGSLAEDQFPPLPRHVLQDAFDRAPEASCQRAVLDARVRGARSLPADTVGAWRVHRGHGVRRPRARSRTDRPRQDHLHQRYERCARQPAGRGSALLDRFLDSLPGGHRPAARVGGSQRRRRADATRAASAAPGSSCGRTSPTRARSWIFVSAKRSPTAPTGGRERRPVRGAGDHVGGAVHPSHRQLFRGGRPRPRKVRLRSSHHRSS